MTDPVVIEIFNPDNGDGQGATMSAGDPSSVADGTGAGIGNLCRWLREAGILPEWWDCEKGDLCAYLRRQGVLPSWWRCDLMPWVLLAALGAGLLLSGGRRR